MANYEIVHTQSVYFAQAGNFIEACVIVASDCVVAHGPVTPSTSNWFIHILVNIGIQTVVESTYLKMFVLFNTELGKVLKSVQQDLHSTVKHIIIIVTTHQTNISITLRRKQ